MPYMVGSLRRSGLAGKMRDVFTIVEYVETENTLGMGGAKTRTVRYSNVRGRLNDLTSAEMERDSRLEMDSTHELIIYSRGYTLKPKYVFELDNTARQFEVVGISQWENRNEIFSLKVKEYEVSERPQPS